MSFWTKDWRFLSRFCKLLCIYTFVVVYYYDNNTFVSAFPNSEISKNKPTFLQLVFVDVELLDLAKNLWSLFFFRVKLLEFSCKLKAECQ